MEPESRRREAQQSRTRLVVWMSCIMALLAYGLVGYLVSRDAPVGTTTLGWLWPGMGILLAVGSLLIPGMLAGRETRHVGENTRGIPLGELLGWTLADGVGVMGVVAVAFGAPVTMLWIYLAVGAMLLLLRRPGD